MKCRFGKAVQPLILHQMPEQQFKNARMRIVSGEAFLVDENGYVFHAESGELGHIADCKAYAEVVWSLFQSSENTESI